MPVLLDQRVWFPDPAGTDANGLVAMGGDFSPERLLAAYRAGIFPWSVKPITWWSPDPRGIFELERFRVSPSLTRIIRKGGFEVTLDQAFERVITGCAAPRPDGDGTWISPEFVTAYVELHRAGHAHSLEVWQAGELVGGIYGVAAGGLFAGESMFRTADNASKIALHHLILHLRERGFALFDIQMLTPATRQLGAIQIPRSDYLQRLAKALTITAIF